MPSVVWVGQTATEVTDEKLTDSVKEFMFTQGFWVEAPATLRGASGAEHRASLSATLNGRTRILVDVYASAEMIGGDEVINTYAKVLDTSPSRACIVCLPGATQFARNLAQFYNIGLIEVASVGEVDRKLRMSSLASVVLVKAAPVPTKQLDTSQPGVISCSWCGYAWRTKSAARSVTCPSCATKVTQVKVKALVPLR